MEFYIYDKSGERIGVLQNYTSIQWLSAYDETGEFQIQASYTKENFELLKSPNRILKTDDNTIGFIESIFYEGDEIEVRGHLDNLSDRIGYGTIQIKQVEKDIYGVIQVNKRGLDIQYASLKGFNEEVSSSSNYPILRTLISMICKSTSLGYRMVKNQQTLNVFELYKKEINENVIFSQNYGNILTQSYQYDCSEFKNYAVVIGEEVEGKDRAVVYVDKTNGDSRKEVLVDAKNVKHTYKDEANIEHTLTDEEYDQVLYQRGLETLQETNISIDYKVDIDLTNESFIYGIDFSLGDIVKVKSEQFQLMQWFRIEKVKEIYEKNYRIVLTLRAIY